MSGEYPGGPQLHGIADTVGGTLPFTGMDLALYLIVGMVILLAGVALRVFTRATR